MGLIPNDEIKVVGKNMKQLCRATVLVKRIVENGVEISYTPEELQVLLIWAYRRII